MKWKVACLVNLLLACQSLLATAVITRNPLRDYLLDFEAEDEAEIISTEVDLNGDGLSEHLISCTTAHNGRQGNIWVLYESRLDGTWIRREETADYEAIVFHRKAVATETLDGGKRRLVAYSPGNSVDGVTFQLALGDDGVVLTEGKAMAGGGGDSQLYQSVFANPDTQLHFTMEPAGPLKRRHLPFGGWFRHLTLGKLIFLILCVVIPVWFLRFLLKLVRRKPKPRPA